MKAQLRVMNLREGIEGIYPTSGVRVKNIASAIYLMLQMQRLLEKYLERKLTSLKTALLYQSHCDDDTVDEEFTKITPFILNCISSIQMICIQSLYTICTHHVKCSQSD